MKSKRAQEAVATAEDKPADIHQDAGPSTKKRKRGGDDDEIADTGKKAKKDKKKKKGEKESRKERKEKRKDLQDLPEANNDESDTAANGELSSKPAAAAKEKRKDKKSKKEKKDKKDKTEEAPKKKSKKDKKSSSDETTTVAQEDAIPNGASNGIDLDVDEPAAANGEEGKPEKVPRHIVFVGNLPYTATAASISAHFATLSPIAVRCLANKGDTKHTCKGIAFVEFATVSHQRTCLEKFHHSMFDDGQSEARKINVELS
ncbi:hypothetical protein LLEC1_04864 [Akanthomyces lecanii]|uniref:RRM domain-containing protein n=1 Tax=Cordyceps confragosa TaxID=2714763 RepID=A0A179I9Q2_CORDF|nr:hypothetical protein LLEC1_04864 [Akanthomyces lecanii]